MNNDPEAALTPGAPEPSGSTSAEPTSLAARMFNVYAAPGEVFAEVRASPPRTANWLGPALLLMVLGWVCSWLVLSQESINQQIRDLQEAQFQKMVERGKMSAEQVEAARGSAERVGRIVRIVGGSVGPVLGALASPFWGALLIWLVGAKILKGHFGYLKAVEVAGLANMISLLGGLVKTLLIVAMGNLMAGASPALFIRNYDQTNMAHNALASLDLFALWLAVVRGIGMARLSGASTGVCVAWMLGLWALFTGLLLGAGRALQAVFGG